MTDNNARGTLINQVEAVFVPVADQDRALGFYLDTLGFEKRADFTYGEDTRWMEVAPPDAVSTPYTSQASDDESSIRSALFAKCVEGEFCELRPDGVLGSSPYSTREPATHDFW